MRGTADGAGSLGAAAAGGLALVCIVGLALHVATPVEVDAGALALAAAAAALIGLASVQRHAAHSRGQQEKVSEELDLLSHTLLRIEASLAALDGSETKAKSTLNDVAGDVHSLSQVVKSLAEAMAAQDRELGALKLRNQPETPLSYRGLSGPEAYSVPGASPPSMLPSFIPAREAATAALSESLVPPPPPPGPLAGTRSDSKAAMLAAAAAGEIDLHVRPVVNLPQRRERIHELYPLLQSGSGEPFLPAEYLPVLQRAGRLPDFEAGLVARALVFAHRLATMDGDGRVSVALSGASLSDQGFLRRLEALVEDHQAVGRRLVIEIDQGVWREVAAELDVFARIRRSGVGFALSGITDENLNPPALARLGVRYVKLAAERLMAAIAAEGPEADIVTLVAALSRSGIEVVAAGVEDEVIVPELIDVGVPLAQGLALGLPTPAEAVLDQPRRTSRPAKVSAEPEPPKPDGSGPSQGSLRDFLRRAG
ncbi:EAL domain-containing protein [Enterovirga aerilata]|uniref:EAL domain-containing protein n=1 Tax=Enterovirga aerilata TaxID=2730920 RepID=A0A849HZG0_9HYPH|nr:EAL domain-containing protein [Enterovirga sp. DB1703]NNM72482.1 EAL domain-containing protein [Enterovirga sp. DB1703]